MKKIILLSILSFVFVFVSNQSKAGSIYQVDDSAVENLFKNSKVVLTSIADVASMVLPIKADAVMAEKNVWIAVVLD
ncbi:MAG TPA: hypothetical protein VIS49_03065, partial [Cyclobacteriaceae bacterium]